MSEITELLQSGSIPLNITMTTTQNELQFWITLVFGSLFLLWVLIKAFGEKLKKVLAKVLLFSFMKKNKTKNLVVIKHTLTDFFNSSMIDRKTMEDMQEILIKEKGKDIDLILYTPGGEIFSSLYISRLLNKYDGKIRSYIPIYAMSGGTLIALSTDEIFMNKYSCLGAVDPQLGTFFKYGSARSWKEIVKLKKNKSEDSSIGMRFMGEQYTKSIKNEINELLRDKINNKDKRKFVEYLTSGGIEHGKPLTIDILNKYGLNVNEIDGKINQKMIKLLKILPEGVTYI